MSCRRCRRPICDERGERRETKGIEFLPVSREEMIDRGWYYYDFLVVTADGYIDHPSFGTTLIARLLESKGYRVAILPQPDWHTADAFRAMGKPRYGVLIGGGNLTPW